MNRSGKNALLAAIQVVVSALTLFFIYKFLLTELGVEIIGVWSLVLGVSSISRISELGMSAGIVKFVSGYLSQNDGKNAGVVIQTGLIAGGIAFGLLFICLLPLLQWSLSRVVLNNMLNQAQGLVGWALLLLWLQSIAAILLGSIDGFQRSDIRSYIVILGQIIYLVLVVILAPLYGLNGLVGAQMLQAILTILTAWIVLRKLSLHLPAIPFCFDLGMLRKMFGYGLKFQYTTVMAMLLDPVTKMMLSRFGGLAVVGYYEMANRFIGQMRTIVLEANRTIVPIVARISPSDKNGTSLSYIANYKLIFFISIPFFSIILSIVPIVSVLWIGGPHEKFQLFCVMLAVSWWLNTISTSAYFFNLATGNLRWNMIGQTVVGVLNVILSSVLGGLYGGVGVVIGFTSALAVGSFAMLLAGHANYSLSGVTYSSVIPLESRWLLVSSLIALVCGNLVSTLYPARIMFVAVFVSILILIVSIRNQNSRLILNRLFSDAAR